jgi:hypothetical protein
MPSKIYISNFGTTIQTDTISEYTLSGICLATREECGWIGEYKNGWNKCCCKELNEYQTTKSGRDFFSLQSN